MDYIKRDMEDVIKNLTKEYACILITGPKQVGKSTMLEHIDGERKRVTLDDLQERNLARSDPEMFLQLHKPPVLIDEVQYAPELFSYKNCDRQRRGRGKLLADWVAKLQVNDACAREFGRTHCNLEFDFTVATRVVCKKRLAAI